MLKHRILTAAALIIPLVAAVLWLPDNLFALLLGLVVLLAAWEWAVIAGLQALAMRVTYVGLMAVALMAMYHLPVWGIRIVVWTSLGVWLGALATVISYERGWLLRRPGAVVMGIIGGLILLPAWLGLVRLRSGADEGSYWVLFLFVLIWCADSAAYFTGRRWGRHKLAAAVSPGKTLEGLAGALTVGLLLIFVMLATAPLAASQGVAAGLIVLALVTVLVSVLGDLLESLCKRLAGLKDSGHMLPGHGGVLDRIDSLTAAAPVFLAGLWWLGVYT